ncbi:MAG: bis(5'-nucleosyl)-tetraphosphatase (symmetrical) YqeK [Mogibacterium sp.]|nr:bis(5'-nucleosyl)-tetraphosphatase (symmetrical) YqeK [Mogibacterium sp.]
MDYTKTEAVDSYLQEVLTPKRYKHSLGVQKMAGKLAKIHGADVEKARYAGLVHDIAKCCTVEEMNEQVRRYGLPDRYLDDPALAHSKVGVCILKEKFGVDDPEILMAVSSHTTGRYGMSLLEEILYVSDAIEENRQYDDADRLRKLARKDLDLCCLEVIDFCLKELERKGKAVDEDSLGALRFIRERLERREIVKRKKY